MGKLGKSLLRFEGDGGGTSFGGDVVRKGMFPFQNLKKFVVKNLGKVGKTLLPFEGEGRGKSSASDIVRKGGPHHGVGTFTSAFQVTDGTVFGADTRSVHPVTENHKFTQYDVIGYHQNKEIRRERVNQKILVVGRLMMSIFGDGNFGYEVHRMLNEKVSDQDTSGLIKLHLIECMTKVKRMWPLSEPTGMIVGWYDFDTRGRSSAVLFECNSIDLSVTKVERGYSYGGSCYSDVQSWIDQNYSPQMTKQSALQLVQNLTSISAGRADAERRLRASGDDSYVKGMYHSRVLLPVRISMPNPLTEEGPIVPLLIEPPNVWRA